MSITALCAAIFLCTYFSTVRAPGVWISTERGGAYDPGDSEGEEGPAGTEEAPSGAVDLNTAGLEELETLPGIGAVRAQAILDYREQYGDFGSVEELLGVEGISEKLLEKIRDWVTVS